MEATPIKNLLEVYAYYAQVLLGPEILQYTNKTVIGFFFFVLTMIIFYHIIEEFLSFVLRESPYGEHLNKTKKAIAVLTTLLAMFSVSFFKAMFTFGLILALLGVGFMIYIIFLGLLRHAPHDVKVLSKINKYSPIISFIITAIFINWIVFDRIAANIAKVAPPFPEIALSINWLKTLPWIAIGILSLRASRDFFRTIKKVGEKISSGIFGMSGLFGTLAERVVGRGEISRSLAEEVAREEREVEQAEKRTEQEKNVMRQIEEKTEEIIRLLLRMKEKLDKGEMPTKEEVSRFQEKIRELQTLQQLRKRIFKEIEEMYKDIFEHIQLLQSRAYEKEILIEYHVIVDLLKRLSEVEREIKKELRMLSNELNLDIEKTIKLIAFILQHAVYSIIYEPEVYNKVIREIDAEIIKIISDFEKMKKVEQRIINLLKLAKKMEDKLKKVLEELERRYKVS